MRTCGIISALLLAVIAVPALAMSILYNGIAQTVLVSPSFVSSLDANSMDVRYQHIAPYLVQQLLVTTDSTDTDVIAIFPDATTRATIQQILPQALAVHMSTSAPSMATFDSALERTINQMLAPLPPCTLEAESFITATLARNQLPTFECAPITPALTQQMVDIANQIMRAAFTSVNANKQIFRYTRQDVTNQLNTLIAGSGQSVMFPATLIIIVVALAVRSRRQLFGWTSSILFIAASIGVLFTLWIGTIRSAHVESLIISEFISYAEVLLPVVTAMNDNAFPQFLAWSMRTFLVMMGVGAMGIIVAIMLPKPVIRTPRISQPLAPQMPIINDGSTHRVKTDYETDAFMVDESHTHQLPAGLDTSKLTFGRRMPKTPQPTQQITDMIPASDDTSRIPVDGQTETLNRDTSTQELSPKADTQATQRTDEHRF